DLVGRVGLDAECVNGPAHLRCQGVVDHPVAGDDALAAKALGDDGQREVAASVPGARMAGVQVALVDEIDRLRFEGPFEDGADVLETVAHGSTLRNGFTVTSAYTPAST